MRLVSMHVPACSNLRTRNSLCLVGKDPPNPLPYTYIHTLTHTLSLLAAHYQHCIADEERAISGLEKRIKEAERKINSQRKEMGG